MKSIVRYILVVFLILLALSGAVSFWGGQTGSTSELSLSQVVAKINNGEVQEIALQDDNLKIKAGDKKLENSLRQRLAHI